MAFDPDDPCADWDAFWAAVHCDCLGCLMAARDQGFLTDEDYEAVFAYQRELDAMTRQPCPGCSMPGYVSEYEPNVMHCPSCGLYSTREGDDAPWQPLRQGMPIER